LTPFAPGSGGGPADGPAAARPAVLRPPFVYAAAILIGILIHIAWPLPLVRRPLGRAGGGLLVLAAVMLFVAPIRELRAAGTPVPGNRATTALVRSGPYRISRNPIYLAFSLLHLGVAISVGSWWILATLLASVGWIAAVVIPREERYLERRFGPAYLDYKGAVRRWL
jgi:protein-S-isoprenylcysteine O-methyltransferase Ste14